MAITRNSLTPSPSVTRSCRKLDGYVEFFSSVSSESNVEWAGTVDCGLVYALTDTSFVSTVEINIGVQGRQMI